MNKKEFIDALAEKGNYTKKDADVHLANLIGVIEEALIKGEDVKFIGFGAFKVKTRAARMGVNPRNREEKIHIPETQVVSFSAGKTLKDKINGRV